MKKNLFSYITFGVVFVLMIIFELFSVNFSSLYFILGGGVICIVINALTSLKKKESDEEC